MCRDQAVLKEKPNRMAEMSILEAAGRLGVTENAVRKRIRRGSIPARKEGERWIVTVSDDDLAADQSRPGRDENDAQRDEMVEQLIREIEFLRGQIDAKDHLIELLLGRSTDASSELSSHLRHAIEGLIGSRT
jgi:hypothetical protein